MMKFVRKIVLVLVVGLVLIPQRFVSAQEKVRVLLNGNRHVETVLNARTRREILFVPVRELADLLEARTYYNSLAKKIVLYLGNHKIKVTALNPFIMIDNRVFQMPIETDLDESGIWVPLEYFLDLIREYSPTQISYNASDSRLSVIEEDINILGVAVEEKVNGTLIRIATSRKFNTSNLAVRLSQSWLYVDVYGGKVDTLHLRLAKPAGIVRKLVPVQFEESAQLSFRLSKEVEKKDISLTSGNREILVSVRTKNTLPEDFIVDLQQERQKWLIDTIIIDPGHGGKDPGSIGYRGIKEKDVVLAIGLKLKDLIRKELPGVKVYMTRDRDIFVPLRQRSAFANQKGGKLFISIHANAGRDRRARGVETYCLGLAKTEADREIAEKENSVIRYEDSWAEYNNLTDENYILMAIAQNSFNIESQAFAAEVQKELPRAINTQGRGVRQSNFMVLIGTSMPKILVEVGFLTNRTEASKLRSSKYQQRIAERLFTAIKRFKEKSEKTVLGE